MIEQRNSSSCCCTLQYFFITFYFPFFRYHGMLHCLGVVSSDCCLFNSSRIRFTILHSYANIGNYFNKFTRYLVTLMFHIHFMFLCSVCAIAWIANYGWCFWFWIIGATYFIQMYYYTNIYISKTSWTYETCIMFPLCELGKNYIGMNNFESLKCVQLMRQQCFHFK